MRAIDCRLDPVLLLDRSPEGLIALIEDADGADDGAAAQSAEHQAELRMVIDHAIDRARITLGPCARTDMVADVAAPLAALCRDTDEVDRMLGEIAAFLASIGSDLIIRLLGIRVAATRRAVELEEDNETGSHEILAEALLAFERAMRRATLRIGLANGQCSVRIDGSEIVSAVHLDGIDIDVMGFDLDGDVDSDQPRTAPRPLTLA